MKYRILIEQDEDGMFIAECPSLPGCISQGNSRRQALANIQDAIQGYLRSLKKHKEPVPPGITEGDLGSGLAIMYFVFQSALAAG